MGLFEICKDKGKEYLTLAKQKTIEHLGDAKESFSEVVEKAYADYLDKCNPEQLKKEKRFMTNITVGAVCLTTIATFIAYNYSPELNMSKEDLNGILLTDAFILLTLTPIMRLTGWINFQMGKGIYYLAYQTNNSYHKFLEYSYGRLSEETKSL
ncbi:hypothetical protein ACFL1H_06990 [Nanoarchaeota archaeon]